MSSWTPTEEHVKYGVAIYNYDHGDQRHLKLSVGDTVHLLQEQGDWFLGYNNKHRHQKGVFPKSFIHVKPAIVQKTGSTETVCAKELSIVQEVTQTLREWGTIWKGLYQAIKPKEDPKNARYTFISFIATDKGDLGGRSGLVTSDFEEIRNKMEKLIDWRRQLMSGKLTQDEIKDIKQKVTSEIDVGNARLGLDLVVRDEEGNIIDPTITSTISLFRQHKLVAQKIQEERDATSERYHRKKSSSFNLFVDVRNFVCRIGEDADILISLYDAKVSQFISESYILKWGNQGMPKDLEKLNNLKVLFTDLGVRDVEREKVFLVCQVIRLGRMDLKEQDSKKQTHCLRRPFGVAALDVTDILQEKTVPEDDKQHFLPFLACGDKDFLEDVIRKAVSSKEINHKGQGLYAVMRKISGDLKQVVKDFPYLVTNMTSVARKMGFPDVILPGDVRNDLYVTLHQGEFKKGSKTADKNVEVTVCVCNQKGEVLQRVISEGSGGSMVTQYKSTIYYHEDKPRWTETLKVAIPVNDFYGSHLKFLFRHRSTLDAKDRTEKPFAMSYIRLMKDDGTTLQDTTHDLLVYKMDGKRVEDIRDYVKLPASLKDMEKNILPGMSTKQPIQSGPLSWSTNDSFQISTLICSTKLTHNVDLMGLLKWRDNPAGLEDHLKTFMRVDGEEVVKFIQDTLDALFNILIQNSNSDLYDNLVFDAIVFLLGVVADRKYSQFRPVLDMYVKENFSATLAYNKLLVVLKEYIERAHDTGEKERDSLLKAMKSLEYIFRFIIRSRILFAVLNEDRGKQQFENSLKQVFQSLNDLMMDTSSNTLAVQGAILKYLPTTVADVISVFDHIEFSHVLVEFIQSVPNDRLLHQKLQCLDDIIHSAVFLLADCRRILLPLTLSYIHDLMEADRELDICLRILSDLLDLLFQGEEHLGPKDEDLTTLSHKILRTVIQCVIRMNRNSALVGNAVAVMVSMLRQMTQFHYTQYLDHFETHIDLMDFLMEILQIFQDLLRRGVYPNDWNEMIMLQNSVFLQALRYFSETIRDKFTSPFEYKLWTNYFQCGISFITQASLQLENFTASKKNKIISKYHDMRRETGFSLMAMWYNLGQHKNRFIPDIVGPFLEMTLIPETELRRKTIPIFFDMMHSECMHTNENRMVNRSFAKFENEMITRLDALVDAGRGDEDYKQLFYDIMRNLCDGHSRLHGPGLKFVDTVRELLQHLLEYRTVINEENRDNTMSCTVNLLNYYHKLNRQEMYIRYLHKLCDLHLDCDNFTGAAYSLMLYTKLLNWSDESLPPMLQSNKYPDASTHRTLKEALYHDIIDYFNKGKMWEKGIELSKDLARLYETETFDYAALSDLLKQQAEFYDCIMKQRPDPEYFRVGYFGLGFPAFLQNKVFIYRGKELERLQSFQAYLLNQFPSAQLMKTLNQPSEEVTQSQCQYIQINAVTPILELKPHLKEKKLPDQVLKYYKVNEVQKFTFDRKKDESNKDISKMWLERTSLVTSFPLPGILQWSRVTLIRTCDVSPLERAVETMESTNQRIHALMTQHHRHPTSSMKELSMVLNGIIDAAVSGGIANYKDFYCEKYLESADGSGNVELVKRLKTTTTIQVRLLHKALTIHASQVSEELRPLQAHMEQRFGQMNVLLEKEYGIELPEEVKTATSQVIHVPVLSGSATTPRKASAPRLAQSEYVSTSPKAESAPSPVRVTSNLLASRLSPAALIGQGPLLRTTSSTSVVSPRESPTKVYTRAVSTATSNRNSAGSDHSHSSGEDKSSPRNSAIAGRGALGLGRRDSTSSSKTDLRDTQIIELSQQLTLARPRRPDSERKSRPNSSVLKTPTLSVAPNPLALFDPEGPPAEPSAVGAGAATDGPHGDPEPPPLPKKQTQTDSLNLSGFEPLSPYKGSPVASRVVRQERVEFEASDDYDQMPQIPPKKKAPLVAKSAQ